MMEYFLNFISSLFMMSIVIYGWHVLNNKKVNFKNFKIYISLLILSCVSIFNFFMINNFIRISVITFVLMIFYKYLFNKNIKECIITPIFSQLNVLLAEVIYVFIIYVIFKYDSNQILTNYLANFYTNILISIIFLILIKIPFTIKLYNKIITIINKINIKYILVFCIILIILLNLIVMTSYYKIDFIYWLLINTFLVLLIFFLILNFFRTNDKYNMVSNKYNIAINSLKDYEEMINQYRIYNHENKNLLLAIRTMVKNKEKNIEEYIDSVIENKIKDNEKLLHKINVIPSGGLRATIYSEILKMHKLNIKYNLEIDKNVKTVDLINLNTNTVVDVCKILGVYIDNSIEEVAGNKNGIINILIYLDKRYFCIKISNTFTSKFELEKIYNEKYSTKGNKRGYGLSLVKKILSNNDSLENETNIVNNYFIQILKVKI